MAVNAFPGFLGSLFLRIFLALASSDLPDDARDIDFDFEHFGMVGTAGIDQRVDRRGAELFLAEFLKCRFIIDVVGSKRFILHHRLDHSLDDGFGFCKTRIQINSGNDRFQSIG